MEQNYLKKIKLYSTLKYICILPSIIISSIGALGLLLSVIIGMLIKINSAFPLFFYIIMLCGIGCAIIISLIDEKIRNEILNIGFKQFLKLLIDESKVFVDNTFLYCDVINILICKVRNTYYSSDVSQSISDANTCLSNILFENAPIGLANKRVYSNRETFIKVCQEIYDRCDKWDILKDNKEIQKIFNATINTDESLKIVRKNINKKAIKLMNVVKVLIVILDLTALILQVFDYNTELASLVFNASAIILVGFDLWERKINSLAK